MALITGVTILSGAALAQPAIQSLSPDTKDLTLRKGEATLVTLPSDTSRLELNDTEIAIHPYPKKAINVQDNTDQSLAILIASLEGEQNSKLRLQAKNSQSWQTVTVHTEEPDYPSESLSVDPGMVKPPEDALTRIQRERKEIAAAQTITMNEIPLTEPFQLPVETNRITSPFGMRRTYNGNVKSRHTGVDLRASTGTPVVAPHSGVVKMAQFNWYTGGHIIIEHGWGVTSSYFHLSELKVKPGNKVKQGAIIALSGATGRVTGPHLHWGIHVRGEPINPLQFTTDTATLFENMAITKNLRAYSRAES